MSTSGGARGAGEIDVDAMTGATSIVNHHVTAATAASAILASRRVPDIVIIAILLPIVTVAAFTISTAVVMVIPAVSLLLHLLPSLLKPSLLTFSLPLLDVAPIANHRRHLVILTAAKHPLESATDANAVTIVAVVASTNPTMVVIIASVIAPSITTAVL